MNFTATFANLLWSASNLPAYLHFRRALRDPQAAQEKKMRTYIRRNANTAFGKAHDFDKIETYDQFVRRVPLSNYDSFEPWIARIRKGELNVLTVDPVTHLTPTSGSSGARKLIPFTQEAQREFNAGIGPWLVDLQRQFPGIVGGRAYWSVTPSLSNEATVDSAVPIGFDADAAYLGGRRQRLAAAIMAAPSSLGRTKSVESFRYETLLHLLCCRDLRLISVWHPSFLTLLLEAVPELWEKLINDIERGTNSLGPCPRRANELRKIDPSNPETLWPNLRVLSCWGDGAASFGLGDLQRRFPNTQIQPKGVIATEAFVTLPFGNQHPLAVASHFFEFIDLQGRIVQASALRAGEEYEVVVTTAGGLWRYRLGDRVVVTGFVEKTPSLRFLDRGHNLSDRFGEKLSEAFVVESLHAVFGHETPRFAMLAPDETDSGCRYTLYVEGPARIDWAKELDHSLRRNPHYAYCRDLGQLLSPCVFTVNERGFETFAKKQTTNGARLGDVKPTALSRVPGWSNVFTGAYIEETT